MFVCAAHTPSVPQATEVHSSERVLEWGDAGGTCVGHIHQEASLPVGWHYTVQSDALGKQVRGWRRDYEGALAEIQFWIAFWSGDSRVQPVG